MSRADLTLRSTGWKELELRGVHLPGREELPQWNGMSTTKASAMPADISIEVDLLLVAF